MPRPRIVRRVRFWPYATFFRPAGIRNADEIILTIDECEAIRLKDLEGLEQEKAAKKMNISQPTFHRLLIEARKKIADAIVHGKAIRVEGGVFEMVAGRGMGRGRGRMGGFAMGPGGECVCPSCGTRVPHQAGVPCYQQKCPKCGSPMTRAR